MSARIPRGQRAYSRVDRISRGVAKRKEELALVRATMRAEAMARPVNPGPLLGLMRKQAMMGSGRGPEIKFVDVASTAKNFVTAATPPTATTLCIPVQGAAAFNRIGQKITLKSLRIRGSVTNAADALHGMGRIIVVYDKQANAALPTWTEVIGAVTSAGVASNTAFDGLNMANRDRFIILADEMLVLPGMQNAAGVITNITDFGTDKNPSMYNFDRFIRLRDMECHFNNTNGGTFADIQSGSLSIFTCTSSTTNAFTFTFSARVRFSDA